MSPVTRHSSLPLCGRHGGRPSHSSLVTLLLALASAAVAADIPALTAITNLATCSQADRNAYRAALAETGRSGDLKTFGALVDHLAAHGGGAVQNPVFDLWQAAASALVERGLDAAKKPAAEQAEIIAGFREGGSTFGFWTGTEGVAKKPVGAASLDLATDLLTRKMPQKGLSPTMLYRRAQAISWLGRRVLPSDVAGRAASERFRDTAASIVPVTEDDTNAVVKAMDDSFWHLVQYSRDGTGVADLAVFYREKLGPFLRASGQEGAMLAREAACYSRLGDKATYRKLIPAVEASLRDNRTAMKTAIAYEFCMGTLRNDAPWEEIGRVLAPVFARAANFDIFDQMKLAGMRYRIARGRKDPAAMGEAFAAMQALYDGAVKARDEENARERQWGIDAAAARKEGKDIGPFVRKVPRGLPENLPERERFGAASWLMNAGAPELAVPILERVASPISPNGALELARALAMAGRRADAAKTCLLVEATNSTANAATKASAAFFREYALSTSPQDLVRRLNALRPVSDAAAGEGATQADKDAFFFARLRELCRRMFAVASDQEGAAMLKAVVDLSYAQLWPEERVAYRVRYLEQAPTSAEAALRAGVFDNLPRENRLALYNVYSIFNKNAEIKRVKGAPEPHLAADVPGREACVVAAYDRAGLHFYMKFNDPDAWKARDGLARGARFEYSIMPGEGKPWHWNMFDTADRFVDNGVFWDSPRKGYRHGMEYVAEDFYIGERCHVAHVFFPWLLFSYDLPANGDEWFFALIGGWAGQFGALGGGGVHEFGRAMRLDFEVTPWQRDTLRLGLLRQAVSEYGKVRGKFENAEFWVDPHLGDPAFYAKVVEPWLAELDGVADQVKNVGDLDAATVNRLLDKYLFDLADFRLAIDAKRASYIRDELLK